ATPWSCCRRLGSPPIFRRTSAITPGETGSWRFAIAVFVVKSIPRARLALRPAGRRRFGGLLLSERCELKQGPDRANRLEFGSVEEIGPVDLVVMGQKHVDPRPLVHAEITREIVSDERVPWDGPSHPGAIGDDQMLWSGGYEGE